MLARGHRFGSRIGAIAVSLAIATCVLTSMTASADVLHPVLPASATPHGYSLTRMALADAKFQASGNDPQYYPKTPFQVLHTTPGVGQSTSLDGGTLFTSHASFTVPHKVDYYVPLGSADDSPPILGTWPTNHQQALHYWFDSNQLGGGHFAIVVDGLVANLGHDYLAGPVRTAALPDGGGHHLVMMAAFLSALSPGTHTVEIFGQYVGPLIQVPFGLFFREDITYTIHVI
jgi:hypothetical protein